MLGPHDTREVEELTRNESQTHLPANNGGTTKQCWSAKHHSEFI